MKIELINEDILNVKADAIVNPANTDLYMGGGLAGVLKFRGGKEIEDEAVAKGPIVLGEAIETNSGKLNAKYVIHAATMFLGGKATEISVEEATLNSLKKADELDCKTIAIPALGCGVGGFDTQEGAKIILQTIYNYSPKKLQKAIIVLHSDKDFEIFQKIYEEINKKFLGLF